MDTGSLAALLGSLFAAMLGMNIISPFLPEYATTMGASSMEIGLLQSAFSISGVLTLLFVGRISDRFGRKPFLAAALFILAASAMGLQYATTPLHLILMRFLQGLGASTYMSIAQAYLGDNVRKGNEGKWMGYFNAILFSSMGSGPLVGGLIKDSFGTGAAFLILALINTAGLASVLVCLKELPHKPGETSRDSFTAPLRSPVMLSVLSYRMAIGISTACMMAFVPLYAGLRLGFSAGTIGVLLAARLPVALMQGLTGRLSDTWDRRAMVAGGGLIVAAAISVIPFTGGFWPLVAAYLVVTAGQALGIPAANAYVVNEGRVYGMGRCMTLFVLAMYIGNMTGPVLLGGIADRLGLDSVFYNAAICMAAGVVVFMWLLGRRRRGAAE